MRNAENAELTTRIPDQTFEERLNHLGNSQRELAHSEIEQNEAEDGEGAEQNTALGRPSKDDNPSGVEQ
jgi:hypothetical protein